MRGGLGIGAELAVESVLVAVTGAAVGVAVTAALVGSADVRWVVPVVAVAVLAAPLLGTVEAIRATGVRRVPANRAARRLAARRRRVRRIVLEAAVVALAGLAFVALRQRGPVAGDLTPASAPTLWAMVGALALVRLLPPLVRLVLRVTRRSAGPLWFFVAARVAAGGLRALPLVVVVIAVAQLVLGTSLAATQQRGQESGAVLAVGGDARLKTAPTPEVQDRAAAVGEAPGVRVAVAGRVADGALASSQSTGASVRLVVVDARAYERLLAASDLPDAPQLARLTATGGEDAPVPALLLGGPPGLENGLQVRLGDDDEVALDVVGEAPRVDATTDPVVVVDATAFAAAGAVAYPDTIWAVGPGADEALRSAAEKDLADSVTTYDAVLSRLRDAPLPAALIHLALAASLLLALLAGLGVVLGAAVDAPARATGLGRLRSLGLADRGLRRVLAGELLAPVLASVLTGLAVGCRHGVGDLRVPRARGGDGSERDAPARRTAVDLARRPRAGAGRAGAGGTPEQPAPADRPGAAAAHGRLPLKGCLVDWLVGGAGGNRTRVLERRTRSSPGAVCIGAFSVPALAQTRRRQTQSGLSPGHPS